MSLNNTARRPANMPSTSLKQATISYDGTGEIYNLPVNLFVNFPVKQEKRCIDPPLRAGDRVRVRVRVS